MNSEEWWHHYYADKAAENAAEIARSKLEARLLVLDQTINIVRCVVESVPSDIPAAAGIQRILDCLLDRRAELTRWREGT